MAIKTINKQTLPNYVQQPTQQALTDINSWLKSPDNYVYGSKAGESLYTPLSNNQNKAIGNVSWLADQNLADLFGTTKSNNLWDKYTGAGAQTMTGTYNNTAGQNIEGGGVAGQIDTSKYGLGSNTVSGERLVDESGFLGKISDYMDPYLSSVLAPMQRELDESLAKGIRAQGANAQMSGAFGDARHGIVDRGLYEDRAQTGADITGKVHSDAFNTAMGLRSGDITRQASLDEAALGRGLSADTTNLGFKENAINRDLQAALAKAGFAESDLNRLFQRDTINQQAREADIARQGVGAQAASANGQTYKQNFMDVNDALFNAGQVERDARQEQSDSLRGFQEAIKNKKYDDALKMLGAVQGTPYPSTSESTQKSNDGMWGILGSVLGSLF